MYAQTHRTFPVEHGTQFEHDAARWAFVHAEVLRLQAEVDRLRAELYRANLAADHWYAAANYSPEELREQFMRASQGRDERTGEWLWPDGVKTRN